MVGEFGPRVIDRKGFSNPLNAPAEARIQSLAKLRSGWLAAGDLPVENRRELYLRLLDAGGLKQLPTPRGSGARLRTEPVVLVADGDLRGLVWLEGESRDSLEVRASHWLGITWSRPLEITTGGDGGALAVDATLLEDGSWLVAWAGSDGEDDEIFWSLVLDGSSTEPLALTQNSVPDILPTVIRLGSNALLAWNEYDGYEYRVRVSRLFEGRWIDAWNESGGTFEPFLVLQDGEPLLLFYRYRDGARSWDLAELGGQGEILRRASMAVTGNDRPLVRKLDGDTQLEWPISRDRRPVEWVNPR